MFLEYFRIAGLGQSLALVDLVSRILFIVFFALILVIGGWKIRRSLAAGLVLIYGFWLLLHNAGLLR